MAALTESSARTRIDVAEAAEIARMVRTDDPNVIATADLEARLGASGLVLDGLRVRPRYFDGRFLTGADLTRDQDYVRRRQADLARATGTGVVTGLEVSLGGSPGGEEFVIRPGHGVTPSGDLVLVTTTRRIAPLDLAAVERLDATLGLRAVPRAPLGRRSGLFILALRPVEFTANPIAAYPTTIDGPRRVEDGDVIEATAITLIPYPDIGGAATLGEARRLVARRLFLGEASGMPTDALPLAMVALERGAVRWIDMALVRRETGADTPLQVSLGARPRALAEAFVQQYRAHLADVLLERAGSGQPPGFAAAQYFAALPAAGPMPAAAMLTDAMGFRQLYFPPAVDVEVSFVPSDEIAGIVEESLAMPPIDLMGAAEELDATGIVVLVPVTRQRLHRFRATLTAISRAARPDPAQGLRQAPIRMLDAMLARRAKRVETAIRDAAAEAAAAAAEAETRAWLAAWGEAVGAIPRDGTLPPLVWYVRRRAVPDRSVIEGVAVPITGEDVAQDADVEKRLSELGLRDRYLTLVDKTTNAAAGRVTALLSGSRVTRSPVLTIAALDTLEARRKRAGDTALGEREVLDVAYDFGHPRLGEGLDRATTKLGGDFLGAEGATWLGESGRALDVDALLRDAEDSELGRQAQLVADAVKRKDAGALDKLLQAPQR